MEPLTPDSTLSRVVDILARQPPQRTPADLRKLATYLRNLDGFFHSLDQLDVEIIGKWLGYEFVAAGEPVYREGEFGENMYIIIGGTCDVFPPAGSAVPSDTALLHVGQAFGELALVAARKPRSRTVAASTAGGSSGNSSSTGGASRAGVHLATLHRSALSHMRFVAAASAEAGRALQAVLAACCMGVLRVPPGSRSQEEVDTLAEFFGVMEAFKKLPADMVRRLAADAGHVRLPAGRLVFEEDAPGHCMYVVVRGSCAVRARPLAARPACPGGAGLRGIGMGLRGGGGLKGGGGGAGGERGFGTALSMGRSAASGSTRGESSPGHRSMMSSARQSSVSRATAAMEAEEAAEKAGGGSDGEGLGVPGGAGGGVGRWGASGFTTLLTVRAARKARERHPGAEEGEEGEQEEEGEEDGEGGSPRKAAAAVAPAQPARDSPFWIARFMEDALKRLHVGDSSAGLGQAMTPLAAVAAARWRQAAAARRSNGGGKDGSGEGPAAPETEGADAATAAAAEGDGQAMEALLGRAAARALRAAVSLNRLRGAGAGVTGKRPDGGAYIEEVEDEEGQEQDQQEGAPNPAAVVAASGLAAAKGGAAGKVRAGKGGDQEEGEEEGEGDDRLAPLHHDGHHHLGGGGGQHPLTEPSLRAHSGGGGGLPGAPATGGGRMTAIEDPAKRLLSQVGRADPSAVSRTLLGELVQRADVNVVLYEVAKKMVRRGGGPRRISRTASKHIQRALQQQIRAGPDRLQPTVQGQRVLGRHPSVGHGAVYYGGGGGGALRASGEGPWGGSGEPAQRVSGGGSAATWGAEGGRRSYNGGGGAYGTRPVSAMTSGASVWHTEGGTTEYDDYEDDATDLDWNGSDLFSVVSYGKRSTALGGGSQYGGGRRRTTLQDLPDIIAHTGVNTDLMSPAELEAVYGPVIRVVGPGQSFGELALLHRDARRTATVVALPPSAASLGPETSSGAAAAVASAAVPPSLPMLGAGPGLTPELSSASLHGGPGGGPGGVDDGPAVDLICIHRHTYNHTVRAVQVAQLQSLLSFLGGLAPFRGLDERQRAALAVFCRPREVAAGAVLAVQGEPANALWMVQEGEVVLLDSSCGVAETMMATPGSVARTALLRNISAPAGRAGGVGDSGTGPQPAHQLGPGGPGGRLLLRQLSAPEAQRVVAAGGRLPPVALGVRKEAGGGGGRVMFDSGASAAEQQRAAASGAAPDGPLRHVAPGALLGLGGTLAALGPGGLFGEGLLANLHKDQPPAPGAAWEEDASSNKSSTAATSRTGRVRPLRHTAPPPPPHPCTAIARRPTKLLYISAHDLSRFAELVAEPLSQLAAARGDFLATRTASVSAAKDAVTERVAGARRMLSDLRHMQAAGVPVASNPRLLEDLRQEQVAAAAATAAESEHPPPPPLSAAAREAAEAAAAIQMIQAAGGRVRALLPGGGVGVLDLTATATAARGKPPSGRVSGSARSSRGGSSSGGGAGQPLNRIVQQLHPIAGRLAACLHDSTPKLPPRLPPTPPADGDGSGGSGYRPVLMRQLSEASSAAAHSLSTIQEESSSGMLRAAGVLLTQRRDLMTPEPLTAPAAAAAGVVAVESSGNLWREEKEESGEVEQEPSEEAVLPSSAVEAAAVHSTQGVVTQMAEQLQSFYQLLGQVPGSRDGASRPDTLVVPPPAAAAATAASHTSGATVLPPLPLRQPSLTSPTPPAPVPAAAAATQPLLPPLHSTPSLGRTDSRRRPSHHGFLASPSTSFSARTAPGAIMLAAQDSAANAPLASEYAPPSLESVSQASLRSYPSIGPTASAVAAGLTSAGGPLANESSGGGGAGTGNVGAVRPDSAEADTPSRLYGALREGGSMGVGGHGGARGLLPALNHPHHQALLALAGAGGPPSRGSHADADSMAIYSDDGSTSPDLSMLSREVVGGPEGAALGAGAIAGGATGGSTPGVASPPPLSHPRRPMAAVRRSTSNISEGLVQLLAATPGDLPSTPAAAAAAAVGATFGGRVSLSGGPGSDGRILEAPGAALDVVVGGRPRPLSRGDSMRSTGGGHRTSTTGGGGSNRVSLNGGGAVSSPHLDLLSAAVAAATTFGAASAEAGVAAGGSDFATATAAAAARAPLQLLTPMESMDTEAHQQAAATAAAATAATAPATAVTGAEAGSSHAGGEGPLLPWSYVDAADFGPAATAQEPQAVPQLQALAEGAEPLVPPLSLAALKLRSRILGEDYSSDGGSLGGADSGACSPRAAMTDSPLRARRGAGGFESPAHSPRVMSHVY